MTNKRGHCCRFLADAFYQVKRFCSPFPESFVFDQAHVVLIHPSLFIWQVKTETLFSLIYYYRVTLIGFPNVESPLNYLDKDDVDVLYNLTNPPPPPVECNIKRKTRETHISS